MLPFAYDYPSGMGRESLIYLGFYFELEGQDTWLQCRE